MTKLEKKLRAAWRRLSRDLRAGETTLPDAELRLLVAVSGGADSTALLEALARWRQRDGLAVTLLAAHLNHQLRGAESDADENFVRDLAARLGAPILIERIDVGEQARAAKQNLEAAARRLRYDFLRRAAERSQAHFVLTAHTLDDQAETILMRLLRGAGAEGLRGIHESRQLGDQVKLIRPMLAVTRVEVLAHCERRGLAFRADSSNLSPDFTRNRIRRELMPLLRAFNPRVEEALARAAELLTEDDAHLRSLAADPFVAASEDSSLNIIPLLEAPPAIRRRVLRLWLQERRGGLRRIEFSHLEAIDRLMARGQSGRSVELPGGWRARREFDQLKLLRVDEGDAPAATGPSPLRAGDARIFGAFEIKLLRHLRRHQAEMFMAQNRAAREIVALRESEELNGLRLRARAPGDAYVPAGRHHAIKLKTLMIRHRIPVSRRDAHPALVTVDDRIVWSPGLPVAREFAPNDDESERALIVAQKVGGA